MKVEELLSTIEQVKKEIASLKKIIQTDFYNPNLTKEELIEVLDNNELRKELQRMNTLIWVGLVIGIVAVASLWFMAEY